VNVRGAIIQKEENKSTRVRYSRGQEATQRGGKREKGEWETGGRFFLWIIGDRTDEKIQGGTNAHKRKRLKREGKLGGEGA